LLFGNGLVFKVLSLHSRKMEPQNHKNKPNQFYGSISVLLRRFDSRLPNAWRPLSGAARGIPGWRLNPGFGDGGGGGGIFGCLVGRKQGWVFAESAPRLSRGERISVKTIPF
jgi:hypothetical protein